MHQSCDRPRTRSLESHVHSYTVDEKDNSAIPRSMLRSPSVFSHFQLASIASSFNLDRSQRNIAVAREQQTQRARGRAQARETTRLQELTSTVLGQAQVDLENDDALQQPRVANQTLKRTRRQPVKPRVEFTDDRERMKDEEQRAEPGSLALTTSLSQPPPVPWYARFPQIVEFCKNHLFTIRLLL